MKSFGRICDYFVIGGVLSSSLLHLIQGSWWPLLYTANGAFLLLAIKRLGWLPEWMGSER